MQIKVILKSIRYFLAEHLYAVLFIIAITIIISFIQVTFFSHDMVYTPTPIPIITQIVTQTKTIVTPSKVTPCPIWFCKPTLTQSANRTVTSISMPPTRTATSNPSRTHTVTPTRPPGAARTQTFTTSTPLSGRPVIPTVSVPTYAQTLPNTTIVIPAIPTVIHERIELQYPQHMMLGHATTLKLSLVYPPDLTMTPVIDEPSSISIRVIPPTIATPGPINEAFGNNMKGFISARLDAPEDGFSISPKEALEYELNTSSQIDWRWSVLPKKEGEQHLSLVISARWESDDNTLGVHKTIGPRQIYDRLLITYIDVPSFEYGMPIPLYSTLFNIASFIFGGITVWGVPKLWNKLTKRSQTQRRRSASRSKKSSDSS